MHHVPEEDRTVAGRQRVVVGEVLLELAVRVLVIVRVVAPAELVRVLRDGRQEVVLAGQAGDVVARLLERVELVRELDRPVLPPVDEEVLELEAHLELETLFLRLGEHPAEDRARAVRPLLALDRHVTGEARQVRLPRNRREARQVGDRRYVRVGRHLADLAGGEAREPGTVGDEIVEVGSGDQFRARARVHVHELGEVELDPAFLLNAPDLVERRHASSSSFRVSRTL